MADQYVLSLKIDLSQFQQMLEKAKAGLKGIPNIVSTKIETDSKQATTSMSMFAQTITDPIIGIKALRDADIQLSVEQKQQIKNFLAVNNLAGAQKVVLDEVARKTNQIGSEVKQSNTAFSGLTKSLLTAGAAYFGIQAVIGTVVGQFKRAYTEAREADRAMRQMEGAIRANGGAAELSARTLSRFNSELELMSGYDADQLTNQMTKLLLTFQNVKGDNFKRAQTDIVDMAVALSKATGTEVDFESATRQVGIALEDPINGLLRLRKNGIIFSDSQKEQIINFMAVNDLAGAQGVILQGLEEKFKGQAANMVEPTKQLKTAWDNILESFGRNIIVPMVDDASNSVLAFLGVVKELKGQIVDNLTAFEAAKKTNQIKIDGANQLIALYGQMKNLGDSDKARVAELIADRDKLIVLQGELNRLYQAELTVRNKPVAKEDTAEAKAAREAATKAAQDWKDQQEQIYIELGADIDAQVQKNFDAEEKEYQDKVAADQARRAEVLKNIAGYYGEVQFQDASYYNWKTTQINTEVKAMGLSTEQQKKLIQERIDKLNQEKQAWESMPMNAIIAKYHEIEATMADSKTIGVQSWAGIRDGLQATYDALKPYSDKIHGVMAELLQKIHIAQMNAGKKKSWFWGTIMGYDPDDPKDRQKINAMEQTFSTIGNMASSIAQMGIQQTEDKKSKELAALDERAKRENLTEEEVLKNKKEINKRAEAEERKYKNIQKAMSLATAFINVAVGVTKALTLGPILGPILAAIITVMGAVQIGMIAAQKFAGGGRITGPGGPKDDKIPIMASNGEYIVNAEAVKKYGVGFLDALNFGLSMPVIPRVSHASVSAASNNDALLKEISNGVAILNLNLVRKEMSPEIQITNNGSDVQTTVRKLEKAKAQMTRNNGTLEYV